MNQESSKQEEFNDVLADWELVQNGEKPRTYVKSGPAKKVTSEEGHRLQYTTNHGVYWPLAKWNEDHPDQVVAAKAKEIVVIAELGGKGVVRTLAEYGNPEGTSKLESLKYLGGNLSTNIIDSDTALRQDECAKAFKGLKRTLAVTEKTVETGTADSPMQSTVLAFNKRKRIKIEECEDLLDELWGDSMSIDSTKASSGASSSRQQQVSPARVTATGAVSASAKKHMQEVQASELLVLNVNHLLKQFASRQNYSSITIKQVATLQEKLASRLRPELVALYSKGYAAGEDCEAPDDVQRGMEVLEQLT